MDQLIRAVVTLAGLLLLILSGCGVIDGRSGQPSPTATDQPAQPTASPTSELTATYPSFEDPYGHLDSIRGTAELGPFEKRSERIGVYVRCLGTGVVHVEIEGAGAFDQQCVADPADAGTMNSIDVTFVGRVHVVASAENSNLWALAITSIERADG